MNEQASPAKSQADANKGQETEGSCQVKDRLEACVNLYKQQMERFNNSQIVEWKGNFGIWALLAAATYLTAEKSVDVPRIYVVMILSLVCLLHAGWLVLVHDSQQIDKDLWNLYRDTAASLLGCEIQQKNVLSGRRWFRQHIGLRRFFWTSFEVCMTILLCVILFVMLFYRTKPVELQAQKECAAAGNRFFDKEKENLKQLDGTLSLVMTHYNSQLTKCFVEISYGDNAPPTRVSELSLYDAYEERLYADYTDEKNEKDASIKYMECSLWPSYNLRQTCQSQDEYKAFVMRYMR